MKIRVYYEDTDCGNVVYYANYLKYMERSRTEYLRDRGIELTQLQAQGYLFVVIEANVRYRAPARYNDLLEVVSVIKEMSTLSVTFSTEIFSESGQKMVTGEIRLACVNLQGRACKMPPELQKSLRSNVAG